MYIKLVIPLMALSLLVLLSGCPLLPDGRGNSEAPGCQGGITPTGCLGKHIIKDIKIIPRYDCLEVRANNCNNGIIEIGNKCPGILTLEGKDFSNGGAIDIAWINGKLVPIDASGNFSFFLPSKDTRVVLNGKYGDEPIEISFTKTAALCGGNAAEEVGDSIFEKVLAANYCSTADDCIGKRIGCPTVCYSSVNKDADLSEIFELVERFGEAGGQCAEGNVFCKEPGAFDCVAGKCAEKTGTKLIPVPAGDVSEIDGGTCPIPSEVEKEFALPEGCQLLDEPLDYLFSSIDVTCDNNTLLDQDCVYLDENGETKEGGALVKTSLTDKTLIECMPTDWIAEDSNYIRIFDYHPGPQIKSFYLGYDDKTKQLEKITDWNSLFAFLAPIDSAEKVWGGISLASSDPLYCSFKSQGYPPWPPAGYEYEEEIYTFEEFLVPKEDIMVSSVEAVQDGFKAHVLAEGQGCPCFIDYFEFDVEISREGKVSKSKPWLVYSAVEGCIC